MVERVRPEATVEDFHAAMRTASVSALWEREDRPNAPVETPHVWPWETMEPLIDAAVGATDMGNAERRVLVLHDPALHAAGRLGASKALSVNLQVLMPGEQARPHRHTMSALRFVLEGEGAVTVVDGKPCPMARGDMILTPGWTWHEHVHEGTGRMVWVDVLDVPFHHFLDNGVFEPGPPRDLPDLPPDTAYAAAGLNPGTPSETGYSPMFRYAWNGAATALAALPPAPDGSRTLRYTNPTTGAAAMATIDCTLTAPAWGMATRAYRTNASSVCVVVEGSGTSDVGDTTLSWRRNDVFSLPHGNWISHTAASTDAILFQISDREILRRLDLLREEFQG